MNRNVESLGIIKSKKMNTKSIKQYQDYDIKENSLPRKPNYMTIPQKPVEVYDCINNVNRVFQAPNIELENYSNYRDNYYKAMNSNSKAFNKNMGYFSYVNEKTRREREMNDLYSRKSLSKFSTQLRESTNFGGKHPSPKLKNNLMKPETESHRYEAANVKTFRENTVNKSQRLGEKQSSGFAVSMKNRRSSNQLP